MGFVGFLCALASAASLQHAALQSDLVKLTRGFDGRVGICVEDAAGRSCVNDTARFPLQSVMKLFVGIAVMDAVDHHGWNLSDDAIVDRSDRSVGVQPIMELVTGDGFRTTIDDLVRRAIVDSDSAATDKLIGMLGGTRAVQAVLDRLRLAGVRIDRDERHLQPETMGFAWRAEFVDPAAFDRASAAVPEARRDAAVRTYQADVRDTATPAGMAALLRRLAAGELASASSTRRLFAIMAETTTFPDRLKAGLSGGWTLAHKTGTSGTWKGLTVCTNDVGILTAPDGHAVSVAVFIADSRATDAARAALMAGVTRAVIKNYR